MEEGIQAGNFLEYGENKGHLYGTAISTVQQAMETNRVPVLDLYPQVRLTASSIDYDICSMNSKSMYCA